MTPGGARLGRKIAAALGDAELHLSAALAGAIPGAVPFERLADAVAGRFRAHRGHVFVMATGIVVRLIAPHMRHKTIDPAVVVVDEGGRHAISLLSGHLGGGNRLAQDVAHVLGCEAVITTATDTCRVPAIDLIAQERHLAIENPEAIKHVNMALLTGSPIAVHDPYRFLENALPPRQTVTAVDPPAPAEDGMAGISVDDACRELPGRWLRLRPPTLVAGLGCNRGTAADELRGFLLETLAANRLAAGSAACLATIDIKRDEPGLIALAGELAVPLVFFSKAELNRVRGVASPSAMVMKHVGVESVCEAAAILGAGNGSLIVPKRRRGNVTVAIARNASMSSA